MRKNLEEQNKIPTSHEVDVLVCGGGPAGIGAAIVAARQGAHVMVIEAQGCLGGIATAGMMSHWGGRSSSKVMQEIFDLTYQKAKDIGWAHENGCGQDAIYHDIQKIVLEEMFLKENIEVLYYTLFCKAVVENGAIIGAIVENKSGRSFIKAKRVVDATGDGDVAASAGVPYFKGREEDGRMQPATIMFKIGGVDYTIPYGCLLPKNVEGLLLSGRNISGSHMAHSNFRIMSVCIALGEAAGAAAAISIKENKLLRDIDVAKIQAIVGE